MALAAVSFAIILLTLRGSLAQDSSYNILDNALEDFITDYKVEAAAAIQVANTVTQRQVLVGLTQMLYPFRVLLRSNGRNVTGTPEESCLRATYSLADVTSYPQNAFTQVTSLANVSFEISNFYAAYFIDCTSRQAQTLNKNLERIPAVQNTLKQLVANGKLSITPCPVSYANNDTRLPLLNHTDACVTYYTRSLQKLRTLFVKAVEGGDIEGEDLTIGSENIVNKVLYFIPNCLFAASDDAIATANIYLKDVAKCVGNNRWNDRELSVFDQVPHIQATLQTLSQLYTTKNNNIDIILSNYGNIAFLNNELEAGTAFRNQTNLVESIYNETYTKALSLFANSTNIRFKICVYGAARSLQKQIQLREIKLRTCVDVALNETKKLLNGYTNTLNPLRGSLTELTTLTAEPINCFTANLFKAFEVEECFTSLLDSMNGRRLALQGANIEDFRKALRNYTGSVSIEQFCRSSISPPTAELQDLIKCSPLLASK